MQRFAPLFLRNEKRRSKCLKQLEERKSIRSHILEGHHSDSRWQPINSNLAVPLPGSPIYRRWSFTTFVGERSTRDGRVIPSEAGNWHVTDGRRNLRQGIFTRRSIAALGSERSSRAGRLPHLAASDLCVPDEPRGWRRAVGACGKVGAIGGDRPAPAGRVMQTAVIDRSLKIQFWRFQ